MTLFHHAITHHLSIYISQMFERDRYPYSLTPTQSKSRPINLLFLFYRFVLIIIYLYRSFPSLRFRHFKRKPPTNQPIMNHDFFFLFFFFGCQQNKYEFQERTWSEILKRRGLRNGEECTKEVKFPILS